MRCFAIILALVAAFSTAALAQQSGVKRDLLERGDLAAAPQLETIVGTAEIAAGTSSGRHTHPGPEFGYVLKGSITMKIEGRPDRKLKAGDHYQIPAATAHEAIASKGRTAKVIATWVVEKAKPFAEAAK